MIWHISHRADPEARVIADRHYNRQSPGARQFVPPGRCLVLKAPGAFWVTSWPFAQYVKHQWGGAFVCSAFRNERRDQLSSDLVRTACAATRWKWPDLPELGMVTFVNADRVRKKRDPGRCFLRADFRPVGKTKGGLHVLQLKPENFPEPLEPKGTSMSMDFSPK